MTGHEEAGLDEATGEAPWLRVVRGAPTDEELAALTVVLRARTASSAAPADPPLRGWSAYARTAPRLTRPGPGAWVMSGRHP